MDKVTVRVMSHSCKMSDITDQGVSLVEDIFRRRQPLPQLDAIYFVQPTKENVIMFLSDMSGRDPLYKKAYLYFSSTIQKDLVNRIKKDASVLPRIGALREGFITDHAKALEELYGDDAQNSRRFDKCLNVMATRIATVFASLKIAPVIHEWTYDAMCHDLLNLEGNKYVHEVPSKSGDQPERKEVLLEDHDPVWLELRHTHIAEASERLHDKMANFVSKNKAAQLQQRDAGELSTRDIQKLVQALPQYNEQMEKLSLHVALAKLSDSDMKAVKNMKLIEGYDSRKTSKGTFSLKFDSVKRKHASRKDRSGGEEETWALFRFYPMIEELAENLSKGELSKDEYYCMNSPSPPSHGTQGKTGASQSGSGQSNAQRSRRTANWARSKSSDDGYSSDSVLRATPSEFKKMGQRIFVFVIGGATRSELRACHKLTAKLRREVVLGSTSLDDPSQYITKLKSLSEKELSVDDIKI
ncbi:UNVERIFIED_CONTAM: protein transport Sec1a [Sesamum latifolium]|uniref:Protein transport Sec1a n=1 Tax=Sesamum latifolium TaxID=2727402 RepID=A0AAW2U4S2_9LAMI